MGGYETKRALPAAALSVSVRHRRMRRAFSLAEIMIAIGILGIGMLMVAATFPVGLDQSRIVTEQSIAPNVANEAFARLELMLDEPDSFKRVGVWPPAAALTDSFRQSLRRAVPTGASAVLRNSLLNGGAAGAEAPFNVWLAAPYADGSVPIGGLGTRFYPSVPGQCRVGTTPWVYDWRIPRVSTTPGTAPELTDPAYSWSALYRRPSDTSVQFVVFVNRRSTRWPVMAAPGANSSGNTIVLPLVGPPPYGVTAPAISCSADSFNEGGFIVGANGSISRIKMIDRTQSAMFPQGTLIVDPPVTDFSQLWFIPLDPALGRSPCIAVYSRTFPM